VLRISHFCPSINKEIVIKQYLRQTFSGQIVPPHFVVAILNTYNIQIRFRRFLAKVEIGKGIELRKLFVRDCEKVFHKWKI
jgi:hypothetical protein